LKSAGCASFTRLRLSQLPTSSQTPTKTHHTHNTISSTFSPPTYAGGHKSHRRLQLQQSGHFGTCCSGWGEATAIVKIRHFVVSWCSRSSELKGEAEVGDGRGLGGEEDRWQCSGWGRSRGWIEGINSGSRWARRRGPATWLVFWRGHLVGCQLQRSHRRQRYIYPTLQIVEEQIKGLYQM